MGKGNTPRASQTGSAAASRVSHSSMKVSHTNIKSKTQTPTSSMTRSLNSTGQRIKGMVRTLFGAKPLIQENMEPSESSSEMIPSLTKPIPGKSQGSQTSNTPRRSSKPFDEKPSLQETAHAPTATSSPTLQQAEALFPTAIATLATMANAALAQALTNTQAPAALTSSLLSSQGLSARDLALTTSNLQQPSVEHPASFGTSYNSLSRSVAQPPPSITQPSVRPPVTPAEQEYVIFPASIINMYMTMRNRGTGVLQSPIQTTKPMAADSLPMKQVAEPVIPTKRAVHFETPSKSAASMPNSTGSIIQGDALEVSAVPAEKEPAPKKAIMHEDPKPVEPPKQDTNASDVKTLTLIQPKSEPPKPASTFLFGKIDFDSVTSNTTPKDKPPSADSTAAPDTQSRPVTYSFKFGSTSGSTEGDKPSNPSGSDSGVKKEEAAADNSTILKLSQTSTASESLPKGFIFGAPGTFAQSSESSASTQPATKQDQAPEEKKAQPVFSFGSVSASTTKGFGFKPSVGEPKSTPATSTTGFSFTAPQTSSNQAGTFSFQVSTPPVQFGTSGSGTSSAQPGFGGFGGGSSGQSVFGAGVSPFSTQPSTTAGTAAGSQAGSFGSFTFSNPTIKPQLS